MTSSPTINPKAVGQSECRLLGAGSSTTRPAAAPPYITLVETEQPRSQKRRQLTLAGPNDLKKIWRHVTLSREVRVTLDAETLAEFWDDTYHDNLWNATPAITQVMDSGMTRKCAVAYEAYEDGRDSRLLGIWSVVATEDIKSGEPIGVYTGVMEEVAAAERDIEDANSLDHLFCYELPTLPSGKIVVINGLHACNEMRLLQDPIWAGRSDSISPNIQPKPVWHPDRGIPFVVFTAMRPIAKGEELLISYGEGAWQSITRIQLDKLSQTAHEWHIRAARLEARIEPHWPTYREELAMPLATETNALALLVPQELRIKKRKGTALFCAALTAAKPAAEQPVQPTPAANDDSSTAEGAEKDKKVQQKENKDSDSDAPLEDAFRRPALPLPVFEWDRWEGFTLIRRMITTDEVRRSLAKIKLPLAEVFCPKRYRELVLEQGRVNKCVIREVMSLSHPARWATPPNRPCYALVAERKLVRGEPIGLYLGVLRPDRNDHTDEYSYSIMTVQLKGYAGPDLQLSAANMGNETRFINDWWNREGDEKNINCEAHLVVHDGLPHLLICTTRTIYPGQEIVTSYGADFWKPFSLSHMLTLASYNDMMARRCEKLARVVEILDSSTVSPTLPVRVGKLFESGTVDYRWMPSDSVLSAAPAAVASAAEPSDGVTGNHESEKRRRKELQETD